MAKANEKIQKAADEAILTIKKASKNVAMMINEAIDNANEKILHTASTAIANVVGIDEAQFFNLAPLKERWGKENK